MSRGLRVVAALSLAALFGPQITAAPIAFDSFTYDTSGSADLNGKNGGSGWTAPQQAWSAVSGITVVTLGTPLSAAGITGGSQAVQSTSTGNLLAANRSFAAQTGDVWFSLLLRTPAGVGGDDFLQFAMNDDAVQTNSASIGDTNTTASGGNLFSVRIGGSNGGGTVSGSMSIANSTDYFLVGRVSKDAATSATNYDRVEMWVNPTNFVAPDGFVVSADADSGMTSISHFTFRPANNVATEPYLWDELRIGTSYADVVPEPGSFTLAGCVVCGLLAHRRRQVR